MYTPKHVCMCIGFYCKTISKHTNRNASKFSHQIWFQHILSLRSDQQNEKLTKNSIVVFQIKYYFALRTTRSTFIKLDGKKSSQTMFYCDCGVNLIFFTLFFWYNFSHFFCFFFCLFHVICVTADPFLYVYNGVQIVLLCTETCEIDTSCDSARSQWWNRRETTEPLPKHSAKAEKEI